MFTTSSHINIVLYVLKYIILYHYQSTSAMMRLLKSSRVKTFKIYEDCRMSSARGIWRVGVILATSCIILKNTRRDQKVPRLGE